MSRLERIYATCSRREQEIYNRHYVSPKAWRRRQEIRELRANIVRIAMGDASLPLQIYKAAKP